MTTITVGGVPDWVDAERLLGPADWAQDGDRWTAAVDRRQAADIAARLRGVGLGGALLSVTVHPPLKRPLVRAARTDDARRRRATTPVFTRPGVHLDDTSRSYVTPEALALAIARPFAGRSVVDATCGAGGNAIAFARAGCAVTAVDADEGRLDQARHNASVYGVTERIRFLHGRAEDLDLHGDVLFLDPPWGADWDRARTTVDDLPVLAALLPLRDRFTTTLAKVPPSFDPRVCPEATPQAWFGEADGDRRRVKLVLLRWG